MLAPPACSQRLQINYHYELGQLADNNRSYVVHGAVAASPELRACLRDGGGGGERPAAGAAG